MPPPTTANTPGRTRRTAVVAPAGSVGAGGRPGVGSGSGGLRVASRPRRHAMAPEGPLAGVCDNVRSSGARTVEPTLTEPGGQGRMQDDESAISHTRLAYLPALDGVRAFAVVAVMLFHGGDPAHGRRVHGRRRLLRPLRVPHHVVAHRRVAPDADHQARRVLGPAGAPTPAGAADDAALRRVLRVGHRAEGDVRRAPPRRPLHAALREQLALHPRQLELLQRERASVVARCCTRGRWRWRSSST